LDCHYQTLRLNSVIFNTFVFMQIFSGRGVIDNSTAPTLNLLLVPRLLRASV